MKKIITLTAEFMMLLSVLCFSSPVFAASEKTLVYSADFSSNAGMSAWEVSNLEHSSVSIEDGSFYIRSTDEVKDSTKASPVCLLPFEMEVNSDAENRTMTTTNMLTGKVAVEIEFEHNVRVTESASSARYTVQFGYYQDGKLKSVFGEVRIDAVANIVNRKEGGGNNTLKLGNVPYGQHYTMYVEFDLNQSKREFYGSINSGNLEGPVPFMYDAGLEGIFNCISIFGLERSDESSYMKINRLNIFKLSDETLDSRMAEIYTALALMPNTITEVIYRVEHDLILPSSSNNIPINWSSSNPSVISAEGKVVRGREDTDVTLTATLKYAGTYSVPLIYKKSYSMTVLAADEPDIPEPLDSRLVFKEDYKEDTPLENWAPITDSFAELKPEGDALIIRQIDSDTASTSLASTIRDIDFVLDEDLENNTQFLSSQMLGKYAVEIDMEPNITTQRANPSYIALQLGYRSDRSALPTSLPGILSQIRIFTGSNSPAAGTIVCAQPGASGTTTYFSCAYRQGDRFVLRMEIDSTTHTFDTYLNNTKIGEATGFYSGGMGVFSSIRIQTMKSLQKDSYLKIYGIKVYEIEPHAGDTGVSAAYEQYGNLPDAVTHDYKNVTEDISLPTISYIKWYSSIPEIITNYGLVNRWVDNISVKLYAEINTASSSEGCALIYKKAYAVSVKAREDAESHMVLQERFESSTHKDWEFSQDGGEYSVLGELLTLTNKAIPQQLSYDTVGYSGLRLLNVECNSVNESRTAVISSNQSGIYDLDFSITCNITGNHPAMFEIGYKDPITGNFRDFAGLKFAQKEVKLSDGTDSFKILNSLSSYDIRFRFDTQSKRVWVFNNGVMLTAFAGMEYNDTGIGLVNAIRVSLDKNANTGDSMSIGAITLTRRLADENSTVETLVTMAQGIDMSQVTDNPENLTSIKKLPDTAGTANVFWKSDSMSVDLIEGRVYKTDTDQNAVLTASIIYGNVMVQKEFYLAISKSTDVAELLESAAYFLNWQAVSNQPQNSIRYDVNLPLYGCFGTSILWQSSSPGILGNDGIINKKSLIESGAPVKLSAEISLESFKITKTFQINLKERGYEAQVLYDNLSEPLFAPYTFTLDGEESVSFKCDAMINITIVKSGDGSLYINGSSGETAAVIKSVGDKLFCNGILISDIPDGSEFNLALFFMPDIKKLAVWIDGTLVADYISGNENFSDIHSVSTAGSGIVIENIAILIDDYGIFDMNIERYGYFDALKRGYAVGDISLAMDSFLGATVVWESSDASVISNDGVVTPKSVYSFVDLHFKISNENTSREYVLNMAVPPSEEYNLARAAKVESDFFASGTNPLTNAFDGNIQTYYTGTLRKNSENSILLEFNNDQYISSLYVNEWIPVIGRYSLAYSNDGSNWIHLASGSFNSNPSRLISFNAVNPKYLCLSFSDIEGSKIYISEIGAYLSSDSEILAEIDISSIKFDTTVKVASNMELPTKGRYGTPIAWVSSEPSIISFTGIYSAPEYDTQITLTAVATVNDRRFEKSFTFYVKGVQKAKGGTIIKGGNGSGVSTAGAVIPPVPSIPAPLAESNRLFSDIPAQHWAYEQIKEMKSAGIIDGIGDGIFAPDSYVTREQFLKMLVIIAGIDTSSDDKSQFSDVLPGQWYERYITAAKNEGIITGVTDKVFGIGESISRQDMAVMVVRILERRGIQSNDNATEFADQADIAGYAVDAVCSLKSIGVVQGYENLFKPQERLTRAEAVVLVARLHRLLIN